MEKEDIESQIEAHLISATKLAVQWMEKHCQKILRKSRKIDRIYIGMGVLACYRKGEPLWEHEEDDIWGVKELKEFVIKYDSQLYLTGSDITITKGNGKI
jgi:hypothetical protein